jgi:hypothetical protein
MHKLTLTREEGKSLFFSSSPSSLHQRGIRDCGERKKKLLSELRNTYSNKSFYMFYSIEEAYMVYEY